jgi:signal peptide peptidase SppA, 36K type
MAIDTDFLVDRRRLKRHLTFWRVAAIVLLVVALIAALSPVETLRARDRVARIAVEGVIVDDRDRDKILAQVAEDDRVKALIVHIDSPGGTVVGGETLYSRLRETARHKPVVAVMGNVATSAAYMAAIGTDRIFGREGTVTGSIGVIMQTADMTGLLAHLGIKPETIKSSPLKAQPNPFETFTPEAREATRLVISDIYDGFVAMVRERRGLDGERLSNVADGRVFSGRQAVTVGLIDQLGGEDEARAWLASARGVDEKLPAVDVELVDPEDRFRDLVGGLIKKTLFSERLSLDGVVSLWHP